MRTFIAIELPLNIKTKLEEIEKTFKKCDLDAKWVETKNIHLTLKFLGEVEEEKIEEIKKIIEDTSRKFTSFTADFKEFGFFPNEKYPRVFFVATDKEDILKNISLNLEDKLEEIGFPKENRFKSHITLARLKGRKNIDSLKREIQYITLKENFLIEEITLFKSIITKSGPIYEVIYKSHLE